MAVITPQIIHHKITVGDPITYQFDLPQAPTVSVKLSFKNPTDNQDMMIVTQSAVIRHHQWQYKARLIPFRTGRIEFPTINIGDTVIAPISVTVDSVITSTKNIHLQKDVPPFNDYSDIITASIILILAILSALALVIWRQTQKNKAMILTPKQKQAYWQNAIAYFSATQRPDDIKEYYRTASEIIKTVLKMTENLDFLDLTTDEIRDQIKPNPINQSEKLIACLEESDQVKYAKFNPDPADFDQFNQNAIAWLKAYQPKEDTQAQ